MDNNKESLVEIADQVDGALTMRHYQKDLYDRILKQLPKSKKNSVFAVSPPGSGKTLIMAMLAKRWTDQHKKVMFVVHRDVIIRQVYGTFSRQGVDMSLMNIKMINTAANHAALNEYDVPDLILIDEAHHAEASMYKKLLETYPHATRLLFSATPLRGDGKGFEDIVSNDDLIKGPTVQWLIDHGYLSDFDYYTSELIDKSQIQYNKQTGEFVRSSADDAANGIDVEKIVEEYQRLGDDQQGLVYAATLSQSRSIVKAFNDAGIKAVHLDGASSDEERSLMLKKYKQGEIKIISNVQIFTEGVDLPEAYVCMIARPTRSLALYFQFAMRVLRPMKGKRAKIIDFVGVASDLGLPNRDFDWSLRERSDEVFKPDKFTVVDEYGNTYDIRDLDQEVEILDDGARIIYYYDPEDKHLVTQRRIRPSTNATSIEEIEEQKTVMPVEDYESFYQAWLLKQRPDIRIGLKTNFEIIRAQMIEIKKSEGTVYRKDDPSLVKQVLDALLYKYMPTGKQIRTGRFPEIPEISHHEIENTFSSIGLSDWTTIFESMMNKRKKEVEREFFVNVDVSNIDPIKETNEFIRIIDNKFYHMIEKQKKDVIMFDKDGEALTDSEKLTIYNDTAKRILSELRQGTIEKELEKVKEEDGYTFKSRYIPKEYVRRYSLKLERIEQIIKERSEKDIPSILSDLSYVLTDPRRTR